MKISESVVGKHDGQTIVAHTIENAAGMQVTSINYGCTITKIVVPDRRGTLENVVLGFDTIEEYQANSAYFGSVIGRHAGRIAGGHFELDGKTYELAQNNNGNHLHGGLKGFDRTVWDVEVLQEKDSVSLCYRYESKDGEEGYPGNVGVSITYTLTNANEIFLSYEGISDARTILNMTNHTYFNLSGELKHTIEDHTLKMKSDHFLELNEGLIPTGEMIHVDHTVFDFREGRRIQEGVVSEHPQNVLVGNGYDHPFMLTSNQSELIELYDEESGRLLVIETNQPAVVLYTGTQLGNDYEIRGRKSQKYLGLCLETQGVPDAIHHSHFPSTLVDKGQVYRSETKWSFRIK